MAHKIKVGDVVKIHDTGHVFDGHLAEVTDVIADKVAFVKGGLVTPDGRCLVLDGPLPMIYLTFDKEATKKFRESGKGVIMR